MRPCNPTALGLPMCEYGALTTATRCPRHEAVWQARRNADPARRARYGGSWNAESRAVRKAQPWCSSCGATTDLTVDHGPQGERTVLCRPCHARLEHERRRLGAA